MATVIRLSRFGKKKKPFYRVVVADSRNPRDGKYLEHIGSLNPMPEDEVFEIKRDRLEYWLAAGAQLSPTVKSLIKRKNSPKAAAPKAPTPAAKPSPEAKSQDSAPQDKA